MTLPPTDTQSTLQPRAPAVDRGWSPALVAVPVALLVLVAVAALVRLPTISLQSLWFDEAYTPVRDLHAGLGATLTAVAHNENTPPLWYIVVWALSRVLGTGAAALRLTSALAGVALVAVSYRLGRRLVSARVGVIAAAIVAVNPLFVWYSQEARAYELYALLSAAGLLFFIAARERGRPRQLGWWAVCSALALCTEYFAVFLVAPQAALLAWEAWARRGSPPAARRARGRDVLLAVAVVAATGLALAPLALEQGGRGTGWIHAWPLSHRLVAIVSYYVLGYNGSVLSRWWLLAALAPFAVAAVVGLDAAVRGRLSGAERGALTMTLGLGLVAMALPLALIGVGDDYLAPRNLIADWVPLSVAVAVVLGAGGARARARAILAAAIVAAGLAVVIATDVYRPLQRTNWSAAAGTLRGGPSDRAIVTVELGATPLEYYLPKLRLRYFSRLDSAAVREVDLVGFRPLRAHALEPPTGAFRLIGRWEHDGLAVLRFRARRPVLLSGRALRRLTLTVDETATAEVIVPLRVPAVPTPAR